MNGFFGESTYKVDDKGRIPLPTQFRDQIKEGMFIVQAVDKCLRIYTLAEWEKKRAELSSLPDTHDNRQYRRFVLGGANFVKMDKIGRIPIPAVLRQYARIEDTVTVLGQDTYIELFNPARLKEIALDNEAIETIAERLALSKRLRPE